MNIMDVVRFIPIEIKLDELTQEERSVLERNPDSVKIPEEVQILRIGTFNHPEYGILEITPQMMQSMLVNFNDRVRGIDLSIDYKHDSDDIAAAWIKELILKENGTELWARVEWTPKGQKRLMDKEFRYLSADFHLNFQDNETKRVYGPTLFGAGLTNRPFIKHMQPTVALTEFKLGLIPQDRMSRDELQQSQELRSKKYGIEILDGSSLTFPKGFPQDLDKYADPVNLKYPIDTSDRAANARVRFKQFANEYSSDAEKAKIHDKIVEAELNFGIEPSFDPNDNLDKLLSQDLKSKLQKNEAKGNKMAERKLNEYKYNDGTLPDEQNLMQMKPEELVALIKELQAKIDALSNENEQMMADKKMSEKEIQFTKLLSEGKVNPSQKEAFMSGDMVKFSELAKSVNLSEKGKQSDETKELDVEIEERLWKLAEKKVQESNGKISIEVAVSKVLSENSDLRKKYEEKYSVR